MAVTLKKKDLLRRMKSSEGLTNAQAYAALDSVIEALAAILMEGNTIMLKDFGAFKYRMRPARRGAHPATGEPLEIPAKPIIVFTPSKKILQNLPSQG